MRRYLTALGACATLGLASPASAAIIPTLTSVTPNGDGTYTWLYEGTLASDQALYPGDHLTIYDFAGYVADSLINPYPNVSAMAELTSPGAGALSLIGQSDDPGLFNLTFTYTGDPVNTDPSTATEVDFNGIGAVSTFGQSVLDGYTARATNNTSGEPAANQGNVFVPSGVPEPATWLSMILGFGAIGGFLRRKRRSDAGARVRFTL